MGKFFPLCLFLANAYFGIAINEIEFFIRDYITLENTLQKPVAYLCWNEEHTIRLTKMFWSMNIFTNIRNSCEMMTVDRDEGCMILDMSCPFAKSCLEKVKKAEEMKFFRRPNKWVILDTSLTRNLSSSHRHAEMEDIFLLLENKDVLLDSDILYASRGNDDEIFTQKIYKRKPGSNLIREDFGYWKPDKGFSKTCLSKRLTSRRRQNLEKIPLKTYVVIPHNDTINHLEDFKDKTIDTTIKVNYLITTHLLDFLNATPEYLYGQTWGYRQPNGSYTGMVGAIAQGMVDVAGSGLIFTEDRSQHLDFLFATSNTYGAFIFRQPPLSTVTNIFILSFSKLVWAGVGVLMLISILLLYIIFSWEKIKYSSSEQDTTDVHHTADGLIDTTLLVMGAVSQQGSSIAAKSFAGRTAMLLMFMSLMFLYTSYSANIVALLQTNSHSIRTLEDILNSKIKMASDDTPYYRYFMPLESDPIKKAIWKRKMHTKGQINFLPLIEGVDRIRKDLFAYQVEMGVGYKIIEDLFNENEKCGLSQLKFMEVLSPHYGVPKKSHLKEIVMIGLVKINEAGLQARINQRLYTKKPQCSGKGSTFISVGIDEMTPPLIWLAIGQTFALIMFIFEQIIHYKNSSVL